MVMNGTSLNQCLEIKVEANSVFEAVSRVIFDDKWEQISSYEKLFLQTWFSRLGPSRIDQYGKFLLDLQSYFGNGDPSDFLCSLTMEHPKFLDWFGKPLVGNGDAQRIVDQLLHEKPYSVKAEVPIFVSEVQEYLTSLDIADKLQEIVGQSYPKPDQPIRYVISETTSHAYNVYPDVVVHFKKENPQWYVAGYGHEAGHILTWDMCGAPEVRELCQNDVTKGFAERVAELCNKLLLDSCGIECCEVFTECDSWEDYMYEKNPGKPLFDKMIAEIQLGSYSNFRETCIGILKAFQ